MILQALVFRPIRQKPFRFLFTLLGIAVGVASVIAVLSSNRAAIASFRGGGGDRRTGKTGGARQGGVPQEILGAASAGA